MMAILIFFAPYHKKLLSRLQISCKNYATSNPSLDFCTMVSPTEYFL